MSATLTIPQVGDVITTQRNNLTGIVKEVVPNRTGTYRIRYQHPTQGMLWTTYDPRKVWCDECTTVVIPIDGEELGQVCPTCKTGRYLEGN